MKQVSIFFIGFLMVLAVHAQQNISALTISNASTVTINVNGNKNLVVKVDGRDYNFNNSSVIGNKTTIAINNLEEGQHTFQVIRNTGKYMNRPDRISTTFNLRYRYNMLIKVNGNGSLELIETTKTGISDNQVAMNDADFNSLSRNVRSQRSTNGRRTVILDAFNNTNNYFTTSQVVQLLQLINSESYRLELAKLSYHTIIDQNNFNQLYDLLNNQASEDELDAYVNNYNGDNNNNEDSNNNIAMTDASFNVLYQDIKRQWPANTQMSSLTNAFNNNNNYFTTYQARQLIQIVNSENSRLQLAKLSYGSITDPVNFTQMYNLFSSQSSKDELRAYVNNYSAGNNLNLAMTDANFNTLYQSIQRQFFPGEKMNSLTNAFNSTGNYFTCVQAKQLIQLVSLENNRLQLAKLSYRTIVDRNNFNQLYDLLDAQTNRNELDAYVKGYKV